MGPIHVIWDTEMKLCHSYVSSQLIGAAVKTFPSRPSPYAGLKPRQTHGLPDEIQHQQPRFQAS